MEISFCLFETFFAILCWPTKPFFCVYLTTKISNFCGTKQKSLTSLLLCLLCWFLFMFFIVVVVAVYWISEFFFEFEWSFEILLCVTGVHLTVGHLIVFCCELLILEASHKWSQICVQFTINFFLSGVLNFNNYLFGIHNVSALSICIAYTTTKYGLYVCAAGNVSI